MYVILGATGNTGGGVADALLTRNQKVRVVGRSKDRLARFASRGAEAWEADVTNAAALAKAFAGARAVYVLVPPNITSNSVRAYQDDVTAAIAAAIQEAGVTHVVALSSVGADKPEKTGPVAGLHVMEERFAQIPSVHVLNLRAGYFMENTLPQVGVIKNFGMMAGPLNGDLALPMIATRDIAAAAAEALLNLDFTGQQSRELLGQRDITYNEVARVIGGAIGRPALAYIPLPAEQIIQAMTQMGMSKNMATLLCEMSDALDKGYMRALEPRTAANTSPTSFEQFVQDTFMPAFKGQAIGA